MKQLFKTKRGAITVAEVPAPACGAGEVLVETWWSLISAGTETKGLTPGARAGRRRSLIKRGLQVLDQDGLHALAHKVRNQGNLGEPLGYSSAGRVVAVGADVAGLSVGDAVACAGGGYASHAEVVAVPAMLCARVPEGVPLRSAAWATVGAIALQGVRRAAPQIGELVVVTGVGLLGALAVQLLRAAGCRVIAVDLLPERRRVAELAGAEAVDPTALAGAVTRASGGIGADAVLLCATTPSSDPMRDALQVVRQRGRVVVVGDVGLTMPRSPFYEKEAEVTISCSYGPGRYDPSYEIGGIDYPPAFARWTLQRNLDAFLRLCASGQVDVGPLVTHELPIGDGARAYDLLVKEPATTLGVLLRYPASERRGPAPARTVQTGKERALGHRIQVAAIGLGGFAREVHLPNLTRSGAFALRWAVAKSGASAAREARSFGALYASTDWREALADPAVDAVVISTRHDTHAELCVAALEAGKHVLVEKPLGLTEAQIDAVMAAHGLSGRVLTVGTNRRYAPAARLARDLVARAGTPAVIVCRVNAGAIPATHWTQDRQVGGGRIIGEVCHFLDLCSYLAGDAPVVRAQATAVAPGRPGVDALDNVSIALELGDGSVATIVYTALGARDLPKERIEVMAGGASVVIDDFAAAQGFEHPSWRGRKDKGHAAELDAFARAIRGETTPLVSAASCAETARLAVRIDAALRGEA